jgi:carbamoyl-phosphate synthase small subunit
MKAKLVLKDGRSFEGQSFGYEGSKAGELVFSTGMMGYPEAFTDPSYEGQILVSTYPIIGNYGVPDRKFWESSRVHISGLIVTQYVDTPSHFESKKTLSQWLKEQKVPAMEVADTRYLAQLLRDKGAQLAKIVVEGKDIPFDDPNKLNLAGEVSIKKPFTEGQGKKTIVLIDCGVKENIRRSLIKRGVKLITVPWDFDVLTLGKIDGVVVSNGPGDPKMADKTIETVKKLVTRNVPILGICLGNQILALATGGDTYKLKFGHRGQNQPCIEQTTKRCYITTQNHGFAVGKMPKGFKPWFVNANDQTNEGIIHEKLPFMSVQFHPESTPGPTDTEWIFDYFLKKI